MQKFILHVAKSECFHAGQIYAVSSVENAIKVIRELTWIDFDHLDQKFFREHYHCTGRSVYNGDEVEIQMMTALEYHGRIRDEYETRRAEIIRLCGELEE